MEINSDNNPPRSEVTVIQRPQNGRNPFKNGFIPNGKRRGKPPGFINKRTLLKTMLEIDITVQDLPVVFADRIRSLLPGFVENIEYKFNFRQLMEMLQLQLLLSDSEYVRQDAIVAIKDRIDGKPMQKIQVENSENLEPTEMILPNGRKLVI